MMLDKPRESRKPLWKKLVVSVLAMCGLALFVQFGDSAAEGWCAYLLSWTGILLTVWSIIIGIHWFMVEEVSDAKP